MLDIKFPRPVEGDCAPYYFRYTDLVPDGDVVMHLEAQQKEFSGFIKSLNADQLQSRYAEGKWSMAEVIGHLLDSERVFAYRMMCISRGEKKDLPGFEQDDYVTAADFDSLAGSQLDEEWNAVRASSICLCKHMTAEMASRFGTANDKPVKVSAYPYILVGHVMHHMGVFRERYLNQP